jgi:hypothetical protein
MRAVSACLAHCSGCQDTMSHGFYDVLLRIRALPEAEGTEASGGDICTEAERSIAHTRKGN